MTCIAYGSFFMTIQTTTAFGSAISAEFGLNATKLSLLYTGIMITFAFTASMGGKLNTKIGQRKTVTIALLINMVAALMYLVVGKWFWAIFVLRLLQGFCGGFIAAAGVAGTNLWFPAKERGLASGIMMGVIGLGFCGYRSCSAADGYNDMADGYRTARGGIKCSYCCGVLLLGLFR